MATAPTMPWSGAVCRRMVIEYDEVVAAMGSPSIGVAVTGKSGPPARERVRQAVSAFSTSSVSEAGSLVGAKRLTTSPSLPTRNLVKFHLICAAEQAALLRAEPDEERVRVVAVDVDLGEHREGDPVVALAEGRDLGLVARLLVAELVAGEAEHGEALGGVGVVQLLEPGVLRR